MGQNQKKRLSCLIKQRNVEKQCIPLHQSLSSKCAAYSHCWLNYTPIIIIMITHSENYVHQNFKTDLNMHYFAEMYDRIINKILSNIKILYNWIKFHGIVK